MEGYRGDEYLYDAISSVGHNLAGAIQAYKQRHDEATMLEETFRDLGQMKYTDPTTKAEKPYIPKDVMERIGSYTGTKKMLAEQGFLQSLQVAGQLQTAMQNNEKVQAYVDYYKNRQPRPTRQESEAEELRNPVSVEFGRRATDPVTTKQYFTTEAPQTPKGQKPKPWDPEKEGDTARVTLRSGKVMTVPRTSWENLQSQLGHQPIGVPQGKPSEHEVLSQAGTAIKRAIDQFGKSNPKRAEQIVNQIRERVKQMGYDASHL
jgi:hypothetical protein